MIDNKYKDVEIIDFIEPEIIDFTTGEDDIEIPSSKDDEVVVIEDEKKEIDIPSVTPIESSPLEATGVLRKVEIPKDDQKVDVPKMPENPVKIEEHSVVSESTPYIIASPDKKTKDEVEEEVVSNKEVKKDSDNNISVNNGTNKTIGILILIVLLMASIGLNVFLLISDSNKIIKDEDNVNNISSTKGTVYLNKYKVEAPSNWSTIVSSDKEHIILMDSSKEWAASISIKENVASSQIAENIDVITENFGKAKYNFSSEYKADSLGDDFHVFKGKYYEYATYVVTRNLNSSTVAIADLKFKGEVDEEIYEAVIDVLKSIVGADVDSFFSDNFEFNDISSILGDVIKVTDSDK